ncbi:flavin reductase family protein [Paraburkholderia diazotrophica]|uniref:NADH-FMN oxidoreductase RutF, flavin reductase (DIM6/NTAB) family n=1 Tax=Paraburkholderia diazotrophica TaxID=667676 RepID=A0A1H7EIE9_9BURK|nr:flavin reductase family protein [Paraburkholderia diazotrophica]SEK13651.1 NADH-FMN oxidoreductase RutF, flavin reductase (DIM6/NTAB) family [Paraburkholderia diazotrophica]
MCSTLGSTAAKPDDQLNTMRQLRNAFGQYPTGVTVITAAARDGRKIGLTANSFASLSLDPPLVIWSIGKTSPSCADFVRAGHFAINVLAEDQTDLSRRFSKPSPDKYVGVACRESLGGTMVLDGCSAHFVCRNLAQHEGGDHLIFIGQIEHFEAEGHAPLVFHSGQYGAVTNNPESI